MNAKRYASIIVGFLFLVLAMALWAMPVQKEPGGPTYRRTKVVLDRVQTIHTQRTARFAGVTRAKNHAVLSFSVPAKVMERRVDAGSQVRQGGVLARLDDREFRNAVKLARATVDELTARWRQAGRDRRRVEALAASDVIPVSELEKITTQEAALAASLNAASARLKEAERLLGETVLKAPFEGTVTGVHIQPGEWALPGQPAVELTGNGEIELLVEVPESIVTQLSRDQRVEVLLPFARSRRVPGRIDALAKAAIESGRLFPVKVSLAGEPGLTAGMTAQLLVEIETDGVLTVPLASVVNPGASRPYIFVYEQGRVLKRYVEVGGIVQDRIIVRGTFSDGDRVVLTGQSLLADGDEVEKAL